MTVKELLANAKMDIGTKINIQFRTKKDGRDKSVCEMVYENGQLEKVIGNPVSNTSMVQTWEPTGYGEVVIYID